LVTPKYLAAVKCERNATAGYKNEHEDDKTSNRKDKRVTLYDQGCLATIKTPEDYHLYYSLCSTYCDTTELKACQTTPKCTYFNVKFIKEITEAPTRANPHHTTPKTFAAAVARRP